MFAEVVVAVSARRDVEVALHLVALEGAVDAAGVLGGAGAEFGAADEFSGWILAHVAEDVGDVLVFFFGAPAAEVGFV